MKLPAPIKIMSEQLMQHRKYADGQGIYGSPVLGSNFWNVVGGKRATTRRNMIYAAAACALIERKFELADAIEFMCGKRARAAAQDVRHVDPAYSIPEHFEACRQIFAGAVRAHLSDGNGPKGQAAPPRFIRRPAGFDHHEEIK
jgi:hypothetical protein